MFSRCPKCGADAAGAEVCPACGLVFRKYVQAASGAPVRADARTRPADDGGEEPAEDRESLAERLLFVPDEVPAWKPWTGAALLALSVYFGVRYYAMDIPGWEMSGTFLHGAMVPFHEFGHLLFMPFGEFMTLAGGSLAQWLMPLGFLALFSFRNRDNFAASLMLWWMGTQWIDLAPYAWDARDPQHILLSGRTGNDGAHDYIDMLGDLGLLAHAHGVARVMHAVGLVVMLAAWAWGGAILWKQFQRRERR